MSPKGVDDTRLDDQMKALEESGLILGLEQERGAFGPVWSFTLRRGGERIKVGQEGGTMLVLGATIGQRELRHRIEATPSYFAVGLSARTPEHFQGHHGEETAA